MSDGSDEQESGEPSDSGAETGTPDAKEVEEPSVETLREQVEEKYDFDNFGPDDMARMTPEEWDAAFDIETWITGTELLNRVEADVKQRVADREVFARLERLSNPERLIAYSDEGYAVVYEDGSVAGEGTVLRDVKPSVALCSMDEYDPPEMPEGTVLPRPSEVPEGTGTLGHRVIQVVGAVLVLMGLFLLIGGMVGLTGEAGVVGIFTGFIFIGIGIVLFVLVANARLSDRFRSEEYRDRLRAVGLSDADSDTGSNADERPAILEDLDDFTKRDDVDDSNDTPS